MPGHTLVGGLRVTLLGNSRQHHTELDVSVTRCFSSCASQLLVVAQTNKSLLFKFAELTREQKRDCLPSFME